MLQPVIIAAWTCWHNLWLESFTRWPSVPGVLGQSRLSRRCPGKMKWSTGMPHGPIVCVSRAVWSLNLRRMWRAVSCVFRRNRHAAVYHLDVWWLVAPLADWMMLHRRRSYSTPIEAEAWLEACLSFCLQHKCASTNHRPVFYHIFIAEFVLFIYLTVRIYWVLAILPPVECKQ
jgi:hypothetical protein